MTQLGTATCLGVLATAVVSVADDGAAQTQRSQLGSTIQIAYGVVQSVEVSKLDPTAAAGRGAAVGGMLGLAAASHEDDARGAAEGALAGAMISGLIAKHQKANAPNAYTYTVGLMGGDVEKIITETGDIRTGDCVSFEQGQTANIRRVANVYCEPAHHDVAMNTAGISSGAQQDAADCHTAKELTIQAKTESELDVAMKKVRLFCES